MKAIKSDLGKAATATPEGARAVTNQYLYGGLGSGKSYAASHALFSKWLQTNCNPLPSAMSTLLMWGAWQGCYEMMQKMRVAQKPEDSGAVFWVDDMLEME